MKEDEERREYGDIGMWLIQTVALDNSEEEKDWQI